MTRGRARSLALALAAGSLVAAGFGCKAAVGVTNHDGGADAAPPDFAFSFDAAPDVATPPDLMCSAPVGPEICNNGCDDDHNGFIDADDPACTTQLLVTIRAGTTELDRLILEPSPHLVPLDGNPVPAQAFAELKRTLAPAIFYAAETGMYVRRQSWPDGGSVDNNMSYATRDVCSGFNNELIVVERGLPSVLHRVMSDGATEIATVPLGNVLATACASDGTKLYVAVHDNLGSSHFVVFDSTYTQVGGAIAVPMPLQQAGYVHCLDFAYSKKSGVFYGLFSDQLTAVDSNLDGTQLWPFALDGAVGAPIDAGTWHGVGEFLP